MICLTESGERYIHRVTSGKRGAERRKRQITTSAPPIRPMQVSFLSAVSTVATADNAQKLSGERVRIQGR
jgi:hypothetical protein